MPKSILIVMRKREDSTTHAAACCFSSVVVQQTVMMRSIDIEVSQEQPSVHRIVLRYSILRFDSGPQESIYIEVSILHSILFSFITICDRKQGTI